MATSFASLSAALTWGSLFLAFVAIVVAIGWGKIVTAAAEREARDEAKRCADAYIMRWLSDDAPGIIRVHIEYLQATTGAAGDGAAVADELGEAAG